MKSRTGLGPDAYTPMDGHQYRPYVPADQTVDEFTIRAIILGAVLGIVFAAANAYLGLKIGMTVTASIPVSVISMAIMRGLMKRKGTILENNIVQTIGSSGESTAAGIIFTVPALIMMGMTPTLVTLFTIAALGGLLGVLLMIPLRCYLIVREHGKLPYPEGTGCGEVLVAGDQGGSKYRIVFGGLGLGALYKALMDANVFGLWQEAPTLRLPFLKKGEMGFDTYPSLLGVGFIIGPRIAALMLAGGALAWLGLIPLIATIGESLPVALYPSTIPIAAMDASTIWSKYVRYIGAGAVAFGGIIALVKMLPTVVSSFGASLKNFSLKVDPNERRTMRDLPGVVVVGGSLVVALMLWVLPVMHVNLLGAILMVIFTFFFGAVASRVVGLVGGSSLPISGMTIAALLGTSLIFSALGWTGPEGKFAALVVGAVVCVAVSSAGDLSQDLKTGFLVGATPYKQQMGEFVGVLASAPIIGLVVLLLDAAFKLGSTALPAPQATLMRLVVEGVMDKNLPWAFVMTGVVIAAVVELLGVPSLPFAVGLYLPFALSGPIMAGGILRWLAESRFKVESVLKEARENGVLFGSGLVAGEATVGILIALMVYGKDKFSFMQGIQTPFIGELPYPGLVSALAFAGMMWMLWRVVAKVSK